MPAFDTTKPDHDGHLVRAYVESSLREVYRLLAVTACRERLQEMLTGGCCVDRTAFLDRSDHPYCIPGQMHFQQWIWLVLVPLTGALGSC